MPVTKFHDILQVGVDAGASDWHIRAESTVMLRVDGHLQEIEGFVPDSAWLDSTVREFTTDKDMATYEEHGDADFALSEDDVGRFRVNLHRQRGLMSLTMRHIKDQAPDFDKLGLPEVLKTIASHHRGITLVTGSTGSGKSTTLACMLEYVNRTYDRHIITVEDPIEYYFKDSVSIFEQREVGLDTSSFDSALIHALRQDPDLIVIGEMRQRQSFDTALTAADTGHYVMSTLHTSTASQSILRILDFYPEEERPQIRMALAANLVAIVCQRLLPHASGKGVVPALEIMINNPVIRKLLEEDKVDKLANAIEAGRSSGMQSFNQCLVELVNEGSITEDLALDIATNPEMLRMNLNGIYLGTDNAILG